ncbi:MAG: cytochrome C oxidase subunit II [Deltaproteobacteria bacterium]|nr:cytochrome C oxidase subunit II [Deltaproteobacteria bacterium]
MSIYAPDRVWWKPIDKEEKIWLALAIIWTSLTFILMPLWHLVGKQNPSSESYKVSVERFISLADGFMKKYQVKDENGNPLLINGTPVVHPPAGGEAYIVAKAWAWEPVLELEKGKTYRIHLSSLDFQHGFSIYPLNINFMAIPGQDYVLTMTPTSSGEFSILCNEYCGLGHHTMVGKLIVR